MIILKNTTKGQNLFLIKSSDSQADEPISCILTTATVDITENGDRIVTPPSGYDGLSEVTISVEVPDNYQEGYEDGVIDGIAEQKSKLTTLTATSNDTYTREDGYNEVIVNVPSDVHNQDKEVTYTTNGTQTVSADSGYSGLGSVEVTVDVDIVTPYNNGYAAGESAQKAKLSTTTLTSNDTYTREDGWNEVTVNVDTVTPYNNGVADGIAEQKAKLTSTTFTANDTYTRPDGWNEVTVNVDTVTPYNNGYAAGEADQKARLTDATFVENGEYSVENGYRQVTVRVNPQLQNKDVTPTTSLQTITADSPNYGLGTVTVNPVTSNIDQNIQAGNIKSGISILGVNGSYDPQPSLQDKTVNPSTSQQVISADNGYDGLDEVTVTAVTSAIDNNITSANIKNGVTILGVAGSVTELNGSTLSVTPTTSAQSITPTSPVNGYTQVSVSAVDATIDSNIAAGNIKNGVTILGVTGTYAGGGTNVPDWSSIGWTDQDVTDSQVTSQVAYTESVKNNNSWANDTALIFAPKQSNSMNGSMFAGCTNLIFVPNFILTNSTAALYRLFYNCTSLLGVGSVSCPNKDANSYATEMFYGCSKLNSAGTIDLNHTTRANYVFFGCSNLGEATFSNTSGVSVWDNAFGSCTSLTSITIPDFSGATSMAYMFTGTYLRQQVVNQMSLWDTSNVKDFNHLFSHGSSYSTLSDHMFTTAPSFDMSSAENVSYMFYVSYKANTTLTTIPQYNWGKVSNISNLFGAYGCNRVTTVGGFVNLGKSFLSTDASDYHLLDFVCSGTGNYAHLDKTSLMNIINNLAAPDDTNCTDATIRLHSSVYNLLDPSDIAIATAKNWTIVSV